MRGTARSVDPGLLAGGSAITLNIALLAGCALALVGAGVLLGSRHGAVVSLDIGLIDIAAWCF